MDKRHTLVEADGGVEVWLRTNDYAVLRDGFIVGLFPFIYGQSKTDALEFAGTLANWMRHEG